MLDVGLRRLSLKPATHMKHRTRRTIAVVAATVVVLAAQSSSAGGQTRDAARLAAAVDTRIAAATRGGGPFAGMTVLVIGARDTLLNKTYGKADLELDVPTPDRAVYEIASVTKQFTGAAILLLQEQGKLSLDDELTKYLPNYPTQGHRVTLRHLLAHTSGIKGFRTTDPEFMAIMAQSLPRDTLLAIYGRKPFDFAPGSKESYSNTGYVLLGHVIEKASGMSYESYVKQHLLDKAGMLDSRYCSNTEIVPRRARGYDVVKGALKPSPYLDHRWGFAAGSLCSTAGDVARWTQALHGGKILSPASYKEMMEPSTLNDGTKLRYTKGLQLLDVSGHRMIGHGGGVYGFTAAVGYLPDDSLTIVTLMNTRGPFTASEAAIALLRAVLGDKSPGGRP